MQSDGVVGVLCRPDRPVDGGILVLGGSEGGTPTETAEALATDTGRPVLGLSYFGAPGLPRHLVEIPLESVQRAGRWLIDNAAGERVGLLGASKGGELALLAAATFPELFSAVVAFVPSSVVFEGIGPFGRCGRSSWTKAGAPLPFVRYRGLPRFGLRGVRARSMYRDGLKYPDANARIAVEEMTCPALLISGGQDQLWPSAEMAAEVAERMRAAGGLVEHLSYPDAGHSLVLPALDTPRPLLAKLADTGGTPEANRAAADDAWVRAVEFLRSSVGRGS